MEKYINECGKTCYMNATEDSEFDGDLFVEVEGFNDDRQWALFTNMGGLTVLERMTGFGWIDIETGYRDIHGKFWLASGLQDVRSSECKTLGEAIQWVKARANTCVGD